MRRINHHRVAAGAVFALGVCFSGVAEAESTAGLPRAITVQYGDLNLNNRMGIEALYSRLRFAAEVACGYHDPKSLSSRRDWRACYDETLADAVSRVPSGALAARHRSESERRSMETDARSTDARSPVG